jgi:hypothetical protein
MTWSIRISTVDGYPVVTGITDPGVFPRGTFEITGSDDGNQVHLAVRQHDAEGRFVTSAGHTLDRAEKALHEAEETAQAITQAGGEAEIGVAVAGESIAVVRD